MPLFNEGSGLQSLRISVARSQSFSESNDLKGEPLKRHMRPETLLILILPSLWNWTVIELGQESCPLGSGMRWNGGTIGFEGNFWGLPLDIFQVVKFPKRQTPLL